MVLRILKRRGGRPGRLTATFAVIASMVAASLAGASYTGASAQSSSIIGTSCNNLLVPDQNFSGVSNGHDYSFTNVGEQSCTYTGQEVVAGGAPAKSAHPGAVADGVEVNLAISGTEFGYSDNDPTVGTKRVDITDGAAAGILYPQFGITSWIASLGTFSGTSTPTDPGAGIDIVYPNVTNGAVWNGGIFLVVPGQANDPPLGTIVVQNGPNGTTPLGFNNLDVGEMLKAGYAAIYVRRPGQSGVPTTFADGTTHSESLNDSISLLQQFLLTGEAYLRSVLGTPRVVLYYGHSSGVIVGRLWNYSGLNVTSSDGRYVSGFLSNDPGGGFMLPLLMPMGQVLGEKNGLATYNPAYVLPANLRAQFTPELTLAHQLYVATHVWLPDVQYLTLKLQAQVLYDQEGLRDLTRTYQIDGVSHISNSDGSPPFTLDLTGMMPSLVSALDVWVTRGITPPPTMAPLDTVGGRNSDDVPTSVNLPPIACPTGLRYSAPWPNGAASETGYVPYDGKTLEPINANGVLQDVNGNGYRDALPTMQQAWVMLHLIQPDRPLTLHAFQACVEKSTRQLQSLRLISAPVAAMYEAAAPAAFTNGW